MAQTEPVPSYLVRSAQDIASARGALFLDHIPQFGSWRVLLSSRANRDLRRNRSQKPKTFKAIVNKIKDLSAGQFEADTRLHEAVAIFQVSVEPGTNLVYSVDFLPEQDSETESQGKSWFVELRLWLITFGDTVIAIYGLYSDVDAGRKDFWNSVAFHISRRGHVHRGLTGDFGSQSYPTSQTSSDGSPEGHFSELQELLVLQKLVPFSQPLLNSMIAEVDAIYPLCTSSAETKIIDHPGSCYVIGRSGTGKTTTVLLRLLARERAGKLQYDHDRLASRPLRQLFVTQSRVHAGQVENDFRQLLSSLDAASLSPKQLKHMSQMGQTSQEDLVLPSADNNDIYRTDLPRRFSELTDQHFPLFITMEKLLQLLEEDIRVAAAAAIAAKRTSNHPASPTTSHSSQTSSFVVRLLAGQRAIGYDEWLAHYWSQFPERLVRYQDAAFVYSEIMGVIKGSEEASYRDDRCLDLAAYEQLGIRRQALFERKRVYEVFTAYQKEKRSKGHIDAADRAHALLELLQTDFDVFGRPVDFLYIDEAQDNLILEALILRTLCSNPDGLFWAGDTAQTLSVGSSFRFKDLRALLHRVEKRRLATDPAATPAIQPPIFFHLTVNYRSQSGIINCSQSIIDVITSLWPDSIDNLPEESGMEEGCLPLFIKVRCGVQRDLDAVFGTNSNRVFLGARQCIIVRNSEAKERFTRDVGRIGLVFTVAEAKGLEFDDVILFEFFSDSEVLAPDWRAVLRALYTLPTSGPLPYTGLCAELKALYVAVTRARKNLWIIDHGDNGEPMRMLWSSRGRVCTLPPGASPPTFAAESAPEEWRAQAYNLFRHGSFLPAAYCFERGGEPHRAAAAMAYHLQSVVDHGVSKQELEHAHAAIGEAFEAIALPLDLGFSTRERAAYLNAAGHSLRLGGAQLSARAARCFELAGDYIWATKVHIQTRQFDHAARLVREHVHTSQEREAIPVIKAVVTFYLKNHSVSSACQVFNNPDGALAFFARHMTESEYIQALKHLCRWVEAAEFYKRRNMRLAAADMYLNDDTHGSNTLAVQCVQRVLQDHMDSDRLSTPTKSELQEMDRIFGRIEERGLGQNLADDIFLFRNIPPHVQKMMAMQDTYERAYDATDDDLSLLLFLQARH